MRRLLFPLLIAGCALAPALAQHRPESPLPPTANTTHVPRLAEEAAPARPMKSVFGQAMSLLIANLQAQQQPRGATPAIDGDTPLPLADAVTQAPAATDATRDVAAARTHMALRDDEDL